MACPPTSAHSQALKDAGYQTYMVGKWHLGHADRKYWPQNRGFDHFYGNLVGEVDYFTKERGGMIDWQRNGEFLKESEYYTTLIGNEAVKLIDAQDPAKPFFLYFASLARMRRTRSRRSTAISTPPYRMRNGGLMPV